MCDVCKPEIRTGEGIAGREREEGRWEEGRMREGRKKIVRL